MSLKITVVRLLNTDKKNVITKIFQQDTSQKLEFEWKNILFENISKTLKFFFENHIRVQRPKINE